MKILRTILYILLALVLVLVLLGFVGPKNYDISRTVAINAPPSAVLPYIKSLKKQSEWGPWMKQDTTMDVTYEGEDGMVGSRSRWEGKKVGKGEQQVVSVEGNTVETELTFYMPWGPSKSTGYIHAADTQGGSEVTWGMRGENNFIFRIFAVFMNMEKEAGPMFEEGLQSLKAMVENDRAMADQGSTVQVTTVEFPGHKYLAAKSKISMAELPNFFAQNYARIIDALTKANQQMAGPPSALYYSWDEASGMTEVAAAIPVQNTVKVPDTEIVTLDAGKAVFVDHYGSYTGLQAAHDAIDKYAQANGLKLKMPVIEEYVTGPQMEPDSSRWLTKIYYLLDQ